MALSGILDLLDNVTPEARALFTQLEALDKLKVDVGFLEGSGEMAAIAAYNELGTSTIPPRPFMSQTVSSHGDEISKAIADGCSVVMEGGSAAEALDQIGSKVKGLIQNEMASGNFTPNAPETIKKKGSSTPLIDTGRMMQSVEYAVRRG